MPYVSFLNKFKLLVVFLLCLLLAACGKNINNTPQKQTQQAQQIRQTQNTSNESQSDKAKAEFEKTKVKAEQGSARKQAILGAMYAEGRGLGIKSLDLSYKEVNKLLGNGDVGNLNTAANYSFNLAV